LIDAECPYGELRKWRNYTNHHMIGGHWNAAKNVTECQKACRREEDAGCNAVDWDWASTQHGCWLHGPWSQDHGAPILHHGVTHYRLYRECIPRGTLIVYPLRRHAISCEVQIAQ